MQITMGEYQRRRKELLKLVGPDAIVVLPGGQEYLRNGDASYPFRQNSDFYYLTGFNEPEAVLVLASNHPEGEYILFNRIRDHEKEIWDGPRAGQSGARDDYGADSAFPIDQVETILPELLVGRAAIHYPLGVFPHFDKLILECVNKIRAKIRSGWPAPITFVDVSTTLHEMRLFKSPGEVALIQKAVDITGEAHVRAMRACQPGIYEYELEAEIMYEFLRHGSRSPAYSSIVGSGKNTCTLHYVSNNKKIAANDLVLIDAGAEYENYAADITRTFPANGHFSPEQRAIYELVLASQLAAIKTIKSGAEWNLAQEAIVQIITQGLIDLGILHGNLEELIETQAYVPFYMHRSGHWLGLDVHDVGRYRLSNMWRSLLPGMVFTIEPGIYISADHQEVDKRWHNIGVRIEDDVLVTTTGCDVLSHNIPKTIDEIENLMRDKSNVPSMSK